MKVWFEEQPERLEKEISALEEAGVVVTIDEDIKKNGVLCLHLMITGDNTLFDFASGTPNVNLKVIYPDSYPYFRPFVFAEDLDLPRHQNRVDKNLCLLGRATENWLPLTLVAELLISQLKQVLTKGIVTDQKIIAADESEQAEPIAEYYASADNPVLFDSTVFDGMLSEQDKIVEIGKVIVGVPKNSKVPTRMCVLETLIANETVAHKAPEGLMDVFSRKITGVLYQLPEPPPMDAKKALAWLGEKLKTQKETFKLPGKAVGCENGNIQNVVGFVFQQEMKKGVLGFGWLFLIEARMAIIDVRYPQRKDKPTRPANYYARASNISYNQGIVRNPKIMHLKEHKISIVGLGALGGFSAIELARNQVGELRLLDHDSVDPETRVRWPLGLAYAGMRKTDALKSFLGSNYPDTFIQPTIWRLGDLSVDATSGKTMGGINEPAIVDNFLADATLLFDATAEIGIHHFLSEQARTRNIPYICISATPGGFGGVVMRVVPGKTEGCWMCMKYMQEDNPEMVPRLDEAGGLIQPPGCGDITFTGAGFDLQQISLMGVRLAVSTLCLGHDGGYPDMDWDIGVLNLFDEDNKPILPSWKGYKLIRHAKCPYCGHKT